MKLTKQQLASLLGGLVTGFCANADIETVRDTLRALVDMDQYWQSLPRLIQAGEDTAMQVMNDVFDKPKTGDGSVQ